MTNTSRRQERGVRFGVYLPRDLAEELEKYIDILGIQSKSHLVQEALRLFIAENKWKFSGKVVGAIGVIYNHEIGRVDEELTDIQHKYLDEIVGAFHVHLDKENCLLLIIVRGDTTKIRELYNGIVKIRGVKAVRPLLLTY